MKPIKDMSLGELAAFICTYLFENGIKCVLTGGACVSVYSDNRYQSNDLDFIELAATTRRELKKFLSKIDFTEKNRYFINQDTRFFIEFPVGPLAIGSEPVQDINELEFSTGRLFLLTPTDCVKDRLAAFYFWGDQQALEQAKWVAEKQVINIHEIERWSKVENQLQKFNSIKDKLTISSK